MKHFQTDGNGGFNISKTALGAVGIIFTILVTMMGMSFAYGKEQAEIKGRVDNLETVWEDVGSEHPKTLETINNRLVDMEKHEVKATAQYDNIATDLSEIKTELQAINKKLDTHLLK